MEIYGAFSLGILFMVIVFLVNDRLSKKARQRRSALEPPYLPDNQVGMPAVDEQTEQSSQRSDAVGLRIQLYTIAQEIEGFFQSTAHPADMRGTDEFELAVSHLLSSAFTITDVRDFAFGDNQLLSCMALESLARHPDGARLSYERLVNHGISLDDPGIKLSPVLDLDSETERFTGAQAEKANGHLSCGHRAGYELPEVG